MGGHDAVLWSERDRRWLALRLVAGAVAVSAAWFLASGEADPERQLPFAALSVGGALLAMYGILAWVTSARRLIGERARRLLGAAPSADVDVASAETLVAGGDRQWFHRADCRLAASRQWPSAARADHERAGRRPCPACRP